MRALWRRFKNGYLNLRLQTKFTIALISIVVLPAFLTVFFLFIQCAHHILCPICGSTPLYIVYFLCFAQKRRAHFVSLSPYILIFPSCIDTRYSI